MSDPQPVNPQAFPDISSPPSKPGTVPYYPGIEEQKLGQGGRNIVPTPSQAWWEQVGLNSENSWFGNNSYPGSFVRWAVEKAVSYKADQLGEQSVSAEEARKRWPGVNFSGDVLPSVAQYRYDTINRQKTTQEWIASAPPIGTLSSVGTSLMALATSPLDIAAGFGAGRLVGAGAKALGLAEATGLKGLATVYGENLVGNIAVQAPNYYLKKQQGMEVSAAEELSSAALNAGFFTAFHYAIAQPAARYLKSRVDSGTQERAVREAIARTESGLPVEAPGVSSTIASRLSGASQTGKPSQYQLDTIGHPSERAYYQNFSPDGQTSIDLTGRDVGMTYADHPEISRNLSDNPDGAAQGRSIQGQIDPSSKLLNLDQSVDSPEIKSVATELQNKLGIQVDMKPEMTLRDLIAQVPQEKQKALAVELKASGFDGYKETAYVGGDPHHTVVTMFDSTRATGETLFHPDSAPSVIDGGTPRLPQEPIDLAANDPTQQSTYDDVIQQRAKMILENMPRTDTAEMAVIKSQEVDARRIIGETPSDPLVQDHLNQIEQDFSADSKARDALKRFAECVARGII